MTLYDILDVIEYINPKAKSILVASLGSNNSAVTKIKNAIQRKENIEYVINMLELDKIMTKIEIDDLIERLK
jgi:hypothetical protein